MSFYGSIYYQAAQAFAKILIKNLGKNNKTFLNNEEALQEVAIEAAGQKGQIAVDAGNQWIQLVGDDANKTFSIWHSKPDETAKNYIDTLQKPKVVTESIKNNATELSLTDDIYLCSPAIYYDDAGHVIAPGEGSENPMRYFKIPKITIQSTIDSLTEQVNELSEDVSNNQESIETMRNDIARNTNSAQGLRADVGYRSSMTDNSTLTITQAIGNIDTMRSVIGGNATLAGSLELMYKNYITLLEASQGQNEEIRKLRNRLDAIGA